MYAYTARRRRNDDQFDLGTKTSIGPDIGQEDYSKNCPRLSRWGRGSSNDKAFVYFRGLRLPEDSLIVSLFARCFAKWKVWPNEAKAAIAVLADVLCPWRFGRSEVLSKQPIDCRHYRLPVGRRAVQVQRDILSSRAVSP